MNANYEELINALSTNASVLNNSLSTMVKNANALAGAYRRAFGGKTYDELQDLIASSQEYSDLYDELNRKMVEQNKQIEDITNKMHDLATNYHTTDEEMSKLVDRIKEYNDIQKESADLFSALSGLVSGTPEYDRIEAALLDLADKESNLVNALNSTHVGQAVLADFINPATRGDLEDCLTMVESINDETSEIEETLARIHGEQKKINEETKKWKKGLQLVNKVLGVFVKGAKEGVEKLFEINHAVSTIGRELGMTTNQISGLQNNILKNYGNMANRLGMTFADIFKFQENYARNIGRAVVLTNQQVDSFAMLSKVMGDGAVNDMAKNMDDFGASSSTAIDYLTLNMARAANQGLSIKETSEKFASNIKMASQYTFKKGVDGINQMTLLSQRLKFNMESIGAAIDKFSTIEGAISTSANLQMLGGSYAASFSNPMQAMGEALLDAEAFTKRIVDSVSKNAFFDTKTGMVDMSPIEKAKMKEAASQLGISYEEMWKMTSQQAKISNIENYTRNQNLTEEQRNFLANTAQFDAKTQTWKVTKMTENGAVEKDIRDLTAKDLAELQKENNVEKSIQSDVHAIRSTLDSYLRGATLDTKSYKETITGLKEATAITMADIVSGPTDKILGALADWQAKDRNLKLTTIGLLGAIAVGTAAKAIIGEGGIGSLRKLGRAGRIARGGLSRAGASATRGLVRTLGASGARTVIKGVPIVGSLASIGYGVWEGHKAVKGHQERLAAINADSSLSVAEKNAAISASKTERNKGIGKGAGGAAGAIAGGMIGQALIPIPGVGFAIGAAAGGLLGGMVGKGIGGAVTKKDSESTRIAQRNQNSTQSNVSFDTLNIKMNGSIKLTADGGKNVDIDVDKLMNDPTFASKMRSMISESLSRNINPTQTRNLNSYQSRVGGQWAMDSSSGMA